MKCSKKKLDKIKAMLIIAKNSNGNSNSNRQEKRYYYCAECKSWHTTSKELK